MSNTYTDGLGLAKPAYGDRDWHTPMNANSDWIDRILGNLAVQPTEYPSASLNVTVQTGSYRKIDGTTVAYVGAVSFALSSSSTAYLYILESSGVLTSSPSGWPAPGTAHIRLAIVTTGILVVADITPWTFIPSSVQ